jgi:predicted molibdopterin-dependent oxidoreductase YjgC
VSGTITLTIDGRAVEGREGQTVLDVCRVADIHIPTLCHDPRIEPYGACRLCLVEIEGLRGFPPSCTTKATDGMVVTTTSDALEDLRRTVVELLLSDHKIECLTCDSAGACALQDIAYDMGVTEVHFGHSASARPDRPEDPNPLIERDMDKCIQCGRCVRICREVQGRDVYAFTNRGFESLPDTPYGVSLLDAGCEFCGQCVSTCPVGALTDKMSRFEGREWDVERTETTCGYCGVGCTIAYRVKDGRIVGAEAPLERGVNEGNLCGKGRYGYGFVHHPERLTTPLVRRDGELAPASWEEALGLVAERLGAIKEEHGADAIGGLASAKCTNEENFLFQKLMRAVIGTHNVDHCARL